MQNESRGAYAWCKSQRAKRANQRFVPSMTSEAACLMQNQQPEGLRARFCIKHAGEGLRFASSTHVLGTNWQQPKAANQPICNKHVRAWCKSDTLDANLHQGRPFASSMPESAKRLRVCLVQIGCPWCRFAARIPLEGCAKCKSVGPKARTNRFVLSTPLNTPRKKEKSAP